MTKQSQIHSKKNKKHQKHLSLHGKHTQTKNNTKTKEKRPIHGNLAQTRFNSITNADTITEIQLSALPREEEEKRTSGAMTFMASRQIR